VKNPPKKRWEIAKMFTAALAALLVTFGAATAAPERVRFFELAFPEEVAGARRGSTFDYEKTTRGLGYSVRYLKPGWLIDVYIYDLQLTSIPDDPASELVKRQLAQAKADIFALERRGNYADVSVKSDYSIGDDHGQVRFLCSAFGYVHKGIAAAVDSYLCLTTWKNKFIKIRMTRPQHATSRADAEQFVKGWITVLWPL
jgi:hypothetical protein